MNEFRSLIVRFNDPLVKFPIGDFELLLPLSHQLPFYLNNYPNYSYNLGRIARQVKEKYSDLKVIDIGANIGDSVAIMRQFASFPILCIEGDDNYFSILEKNADRVLDVSVEKAHVGDSSQITMSESQRNGGTARLVHSPNLQGVSIKTLPEILAKHSDFSSAKMIKIDTDGYDFAILKGAINYLADVKPIIFFEYAPYLSKQNDDGISILSQLREIGYKTLLVYDNLGNYMFSSDLDNSVFIEEINNYFLGGNGKRYCDMCVFPIEDNDLFQIIRDSEIPSISTREEVIKKLPPNFPTLNRTSNHATATNLTLG